MRVALDGELICLGPLWEMDLDRHPGQTSPQHDMKATLDTHKTLYEIEIDAKYEMNSFVRRIAMPGHHWG